MKKSHNNGAKLLETLAKIQTLILSNDQMVCKLDLISNHLASGLLRAAALDNPLPMGFDKESPDRLSETFCIHRQ
jgi:hypothetical protein